MGPSKAIAKDNLPNVFKLLAVFVSFVAVFIFRFPLLVALDTIMRKRLNVLGNNVM